MLKDHEKLLMKIGIENDVLHSVYGDDILLCVIFDIAEGASRADACLVDKDAIISRGTKIFVFCDLQISVCLLQEC